MDIVDLSNVQNQIGTAVVEIGNGAILKSSGELSDETGKNQCRNLLRILMDSIKCIGDEPLKRISVSFGMHKFVMTPTQQYLYIVKVQGNGGDL